MRSANLASAPWRCRGTFVLLLLAWARAAGAAPLAYITHPGEGTMSILDAVSGTESSPVGVGAMPLAVGVTPDGGRVYVANAGDGTVSVIDAASRTVAKTVSVGSFPQGVAVAPDGARIYVANGTSGTVSIIERATDTVVGTVGVAPDPVSLVADRAGKRLYVVSPDAVTVVDTTADVVVTTIPRNRGLSGAALAPDGTRLFVAERTDGAVAVIDTATNLITATIAVGSSPGAVGIVSTGDPNATRVCVANAGDATISLIDLIGQVVSDTVPVASFPVGLAATPDGTRLLVTSAPRAGAGGNAVSLVDLATRSGQAVLTLTRPLTTSVEGIAIGIAPPDPKPTHWSLTRLFKNPDPMPADFEELGSAIAITGNTILVGAPGDENQGDFAGAVYAFDATTGALLRTFPNPAGGARDRFGFAVAVVPVPGGGFDVLVGAPRAGGTGVAYLLDGATGDVLRTLPNPNAGEGGFGFSVAALPNRTDYDLLVGAPFDSTDGDNTGIAHRFARTSGQLLRTFHAPFPGPSTFFGASIAAAGTDVLIGAPAESSAAPNAGAVYRFDPAGPLRLAFHKASPGTGDQVGISVAAVARADGDFDVAAGAPGDGGAGAAYVFDGKTGSVLRTFRKPAPAAADFFGAAVAATDSTVLVGAPGDASQGAAAGAAFAFDVGGDALLQVFLDPARAAGDRFGAAMAASGRGPDVIVGAPRRLSSASGFPPPPVPDAGVVYRFPFCGDACPVNGCGNGIVGGGEACDDGCLAGVAGLCEGVDAGDGCDPNCTVSGCGNGVVAGPAEDCDDGALNGTSGERCTVDCHVTCTVNSDCPHSADGKSGIPCKGNTCDFGCVISGCAGCSVDDCGPPVTRGCESCCLEACCAPTPAPTPRAVLAAAAAPRPCGVSCLVDADCDDGIACTIDTCDPAVHGCVHTPDDTLCDDGARCTTDACDPTAGCSHSPIPGCCQIDADCRNTNACDGEETCRTCDGCFLYNWPCCARGPNGGSKCVAGTPPPPGTPCSTGNLCTLDSCEAAVCTSGPARSCDDGNTCTTDGCNTLTGCIHPFTPGCQPCTEDAQCDDGDPCTADVCNNGTCTNVPQPDGSSCADSNRCNGEETCQAGKCSAGTPLHCDDGDPCTRTACDPATGCHNMPLDRFGAVTCTLQRDLATPACTSDHLPAGMTRRVQRAVQLVEKGRNAKPRQLQRLIGAAIDQLKAARRVAAKGSLSRTCSSALRTAIHDAEGNVRGLKH